MNKNDFIKTTVFVFSTFLILFLTDAVLKYTMKSVKKETVGKINAVMDHRLDVGFSIWGASTAYVNFNPHLIKDSLSLSTFNMGIDGTNIDQYDGLLKEYISYTEKSVFLIIAVDIHGGLVKRKYFYQMHNWLHHIHNENIYRCLSDIDSSLIFKARRIPFYNITLYDKHSLVYFKKYMFSRESHYDFPDLGYKPYHSTMPKHMNDRLMPFTVEIGDRVFDKIRSSCIAAKKKNIKPIVVITPCFIEGLSKISNKVEFCQKINTLTKLNILVYDFLETPISYDRNNFKDNTHLNYKGANALTIKLVEKIKSDFKSRL